MQQSPSSGIPGFIAKIILCAIVAAPIGVAANANCTWEGVAGRYGVNPKILFSIAKVESNLNPTAINKNKNGTIDYGMMQINSIWLPKLRQYGIGPQQLMDSCVNLHVGASILAEHIRQYGNTWEAIGAYHSRTPHLRDKYANRVFVKLRAIHKN